MRKTLIAIAGLALAAAPLSAAHAVTHEVQADVPQRADLGIAVPITGHATGVSVKGYTVDIHAFYSGGNSEELIHIGHADVHSSGNFTKTYTPLHGGTYQFLVELDDRNGNPVGEGQTGQLHVFRWTALQNLHPALSDEGAPANSAGTTTGKTVAGVQWAHELYLRSGADLSFSYPGVICTKITSYVGISDSAPSGATAHTTIIQPLDTSVYSAGLTRGETARHLTRDLDPAANSFDIGASFTDMGVDTVGKKVIFGEPKAFCAIG
jgi:hypothetical protein